MKKTILAVFVTLAAFTSCEKGQLNEAAYESPVLNATIEEASLTKTYKDENNYIRWSSGDRIIAFLKSSVGLKYQVAAESVGETSARFTQVSGDLMSGSELDHNIAYYPYSDGIKCVMLKGKYTLDVSLPSEQTYVENSFSNGAMPMAAVSENANLTFRNVSGGMKLQLKGSQKVASVKVEGKNGEKLSGTATVTASAGGDKPSIVMSDAASTFVTLDCGEGIQLSESAATEFIIALPPVEFVSGFKVTVTDSWGCGYIIETSKKNTVIRSSLLVMPVKTLGEPDILAEGLYIDEYGVNQGLGVEIDGVIWAPVNCGYHETDYPYGKLYQWGRKYGQGYSGQLYDIDGNAIGEVSDATVPEIREGGVSLSGGQSETNANVFFLTDPENDYDWLYQSDDTLWNSGTESDPVKTEYDPCPDGWRVPTYAELDELTYLWYQSPWTTNDKGQPGHWFCGQSSNTSSVPQVFFPAAGHRSYDGAYSRGRYGHYWASGSSDYDDYISIGFGDNTFSRGSGHVGGLSVRCVYDEDAVGIEWPVPDVDLEIPVSTVTISTTSLKLYEGYVAQLTVRVRPSDAKDNAVTWNSDTPSVATVDQTGFVTAVSAGEAIITVVAGGVSATCNVTVSSLSEATANYIDEYGKDHGKGIVVGMTVWAPVNCGYHETDYPYGKLYQWGRKYGQGYSGPLYDIDGNDIGEVSDATVPEIREGGVSLAGGQSEANAHVFFVGDPENSYDWVYPSDATLWNSGTESDPVKTEYDPCPDGWRVPTYAELDELRKNKSPWTVNGKNQTGYWFSGQSSYTSSVSQVFLPAAGIIGFYSGFDQRGCEGEYWSSRPDHNYGYYLFLAYGSGAIYSYSRAFGFSVRCVQVTD